MEVGDEEEMSSSQKPPDMKMEKTCGVKSVGEIDAHLHGAVEGCGGSQHNLLDGELAHVAILLIDAQRQVGAHQPRYQLHHLLARHLLGSRHNISDNILLHYDYSCRVGI